MTYPYIWLILVLPASGGTRTLATPYSFLIPPYSSLLSLTHASAHLSEITSPLSMPDRRRKKMPIHPATKNAKPV